MPGTPLGDGLLLVHRLLSLQGSPKNIVIAYLPNWFGGLGSPVTMYTPHKKPEALRPWVVLLELSDLGWWFP